MQNSQLVKPRKSSLQPEASSPDDWRKNIFNFQRLLIIKDSRNLRKQSKKNISISTLKISSRQQRFVKKVLNTSKYIRGFYLQRRSSRETQDSLGIAHTYQLLPSFTHIQKVTLNFHWISDRLLIRLARGFQSLSALKILSLDFSKCQERNQEWKGMKKLNFSFRLLTSLQEFQFVLERYMTDSSLSILGKSLKEMKSLKKLMLSFIDSCDLTCEGFQDFCESLKSRGTLHQFNLDMSRCFTEYKKEKWLYSLSQCLKSMTLLQNFSISAQNCPLYINEGLSNLINSLKKLPFLKIVKFDFWIMSHENIFSFTSSLSLLLRLQVLRLRLVDDFVQDELVKNLAKSVQQLSFLEEINLKFNECFQITDHGFIELIDSLDVLKNFHTLALDLEDCKILSDSSFSRLSEFIKNHPSLISISLISLDPTEQTLSDLACSLQACPSLRNLQICILGLQKTLTDTFLKDLSKSLESLPSLQNIALKFSFTNEITDEGLLSIGQTLQCLPMLRKICFDFLECYDITLNGFLNLVKELKSLPWLRRLHLGFIFCSDLEEYQYENSKDLEDLSASRIVDFDYSREIRIMEKAYSIKGDNSCFADL